MCCIMVMGSLQKVNKMLPGFLEVEERITLRKVQPIVLKQCSQSLQCKEKIASADHIFWQQEMYIEV